jgi:hypothetical protein
VVAAAVAPAGSARFMRARTKAVAAAAAAAGLLAAGWPLRRAVELAEVATAPADVSLGVGWRGSRSPIRIAGGVHAFSNWGPGCGKSTRAGQSATTALGAAAQLAGVWRRLVAESRRSTHLALLQPQPQIIDASAAHVCGAGADAAWERLAGSADEAGGSEDGAAEAPLPTEQQPTSRARLAPLAIAAGVASGDEGAPLLDLGQVPTSPINRVDSTVPVAAELSAEASVSSATSLSAPPGDEGAGAAFDEVFTAAEAAARGRAGCAPPCPALSPAAVQAHNRAATVAAAACGLRYVGVGVREAAAVAETAYSCAAAVEAAAATAAGSAARQGGAAEAGDEEAPSAPRLKGVGQTSDLAPAGAAAEPAPCRWAAGNVQEGAALPEAALPAPKGAAGAAGQAPRPGGAVPLLGPTSPKAAAGAAMMAEPWAAEGVAANASGAGLPVPMAQPLGQQALEGPSAIPGRHA